MTTTLDDELEETMANAAALIVSLSETGTTPAEFDACGTVDLAEIDFRGHSWVEAVVTVQDWLRLEEPLDLANGTNYVVRKLLLEIAPSTAIDKLVSPADDAVLSPQGITALAARLDRAASLRDRFMDDHEVLGRAGATTNWVEAWAELAETSLSGPVRARATTWAIRDFVIRAENGQLDLSPTYQRGDVWPTKDAQLLIESVLRGIPLPSIIVLDPRQGSAVNYEVVDGKQRLSTLLRFIGRHPIAARNLAGLAESHPEVPWRTTFEEDYPAFRQLWRQVMGRPLTVTEEKDLYFPFKLAADLGSGSSNGALAPFAGRYYSEVRDRQVDVAGTTTSIHALFEGPSDYQIPVIEYTEASPRQIHEVFNLYNRQGKHLNAEEIRNAVYHDTPLMRLLTVAAGDAPRATRLSRFSSDAQNAEASVESIFDDYGVSRARFRRTKILSWIASISILPSVGDEGTPRRLSTSQQINQLMETASNVAEPLNGRGRASEAVGLIAYALQSHHGVTAWAPTLRGGRSWQDLPLVATVTPLVFAATVLGAELPVRLEQCSLAIAERSATSWQKPRKTQTGVQWEYLATVALEMLELLGVNPDEAHASMADLFGGSTVPALKLISGRG